MTFVLSGRLRRLARYGALICLGGLCPESVAIPVAIAAEQPAVATAATPSEANAVAPPDKRARFAEIAEQSVCLPGLFDLYRADPRLYAALKPEDFEKPLLAPIAVARGAGAAGMTFNFDEQWLVAFRRVGDRVQLVRKNVRYRAPASSPLAKAVRLAYADSVLASLEIACDDAPDGAVLVDLGEAFFGNFANFAEGSLDREKSRWAKVQAFPRNIELQVEATFAGSPLPAGSGVNGDSGYVDSRGVTLVLHYGLVELPPPGYRPRLADPRLGHFVSAVKDFGSADPDTPFVRRINRWRLEKAVPDAPSSPPRTPLTWWIEDTTPDEYRSYVEAGILEWNKAFERIGFQDALVVRRQTEQDEFDPEDVNYCVFRWMTSPYGYAMSNLRSNPLTGEIVDGDILFDSSWLRYWQREQAFLSGVAGGDRARLAFGEPASPMMAAHDATLRRLPKTQSEPAGSPADWRRSAGGASCQFAAALHDQLLAARALLPGGELPPEALGQIVKAVVMHEVGHSLGLRHNFRGSQALPREHLHDVQITAARGLLGSVMDYAPLNLARRGETQGDYATATLGPYDYWAIEYAYKPISPEREAEELARIAGRSAEPELAYASDEDCASAYDPRVNQYDLGADPLAFARERLDLATEGLAEIEDRLVRDGESWRRLRPAVTTLWRQYGDAAYLAARHVGGRYVSHHVRGTPGAPDPIAPVPGRVQRAALALLVERILVDEPIPRQPRLLRRMSTEQWSHWGADVRDYDGKVGVSYPEFVRAVQEIAFAELLGSGTRLRLIESNEAMASESDEPLQLAEVFAALREAAWGATAQGVAQRGTLPSPTGVRRNLQRMHLRYLAAILAGERRPADASLAFARFPAEQGAYPGDAISLALQDLRALRALLAELVRQFDEAVEPDLLARAHFAACLRDAEAVDERRRSRRD